jgi:hypothetical protein
MPCKATGAGRKATEMRYYRTQLSLAKFIQNIKEFGIEGIGTETWGSTAKKQTLPRLKTIYHAGESR